MASNTLFPGSSSTMKHGINVILEKLDSERATHLMSRISFYSIMTCVLIFGGFNINRSIPVSVVQVGDIPSAQRGQTAEITATVTHQSDKECDRTTTRWAVDSNGVKHFLSEETISRQARGKILDATNRSVTRKFPFRAPVAMAYGEAEFISKTRFNCAPGQEYFPITYEWSAKFFVVESK